MNERRPDSDRIPEELFCDIMRERAVLLGMEACSRALDIPYEAIRTIYATDDELIEQHGARIRTYSELDAWSDGVTGRAKGLSA